MGGGSGPSAPSVTATPAGVTVVISNFAFNPGSVTISAGQTVTWRNDDGVPHDATGSDWTSGSISRGESYTKRFDTPGTFTYVCKVHPAMKSATVIVQ
jgi:plastocyanin